MSNFCYLKIFSIFESVNSNPWTMKKLAVVVLLALFVATMFTSCKSQDCPTYEQNVEVSMP